VLNDGRFTVNRSARIRKATPPAARDQLAECYRYLSKWMIFVDEPDHGRLRATIGPFYTSGAVSDLEGFVDALVDELMAAPHARGSLDVIEDLAAPLTGITNAKRVGFPREMVADVRQWSDDVFLLFGSGIVTEESVDAAHRSLRACHAYVQRLVAKREAVEPDSLIARLLGGLSAGRIFHEEEVISSCVMLLIGGHEAARHMIGNGLLALLRHPEELQKLRDRPELMDRAMEELLRYDSPPLSALRCATEDVEIEGKRIAAGEFVINMLRAGNHDPEVFSDPDTLDLERDGAQHLGFGYGRHYCTGASLAPLEVKSALRALIDSDPELAVAPASLSWVPSLSSRGLRSLPVSLRSGAMLHEKAQPAWH
jgi:cytochrome P450